MIDEGSPVWWVGGWEKQRSNGQEFWWQLKTVEAVTYGAPINQEKCCQWRKMLTMMYVIVNVYPSDCQ